MFYIYIRLCINIQRILDLGAKTQDTAFCLYAF
jgi:hypothetical protein